MARFLVTGINSGLGKHLFETLPDSLGLDRNNFNLIKHENFDTIIHCAFNKETNIIDYKKYIDDNIFLTQRLKKLNYSKFVYISTVDVYQENHNMYSHFKKFAETLLDDDDLILRCPMLLGYTMKPNHSERLKNNEEKIGLSGESLFNYILMDDLAEFFNSNDYTKYTGVLDFVSNDVVKLQEVKDYFGSTTKLGEYVYKNSLDFVNPIFKLDKKYNKSSFDRIKQYYGK
jgi:nucleoside-diphosphate-sugar epimerase